MATVKLTLSADEKVVRKARQLARRHKTSISAMFSRFVSAMSREESAKVEVPPDSIAARVAGVISLPKGKSDRDVLTEALLEKYDIKP